MRRICTRSILPLMMLVFTAFAQQSAPQEQHKAEPTEELAKPESDRGGEPLLRQPPLEFRNPDREKLKQRIESALSKESSLSGAQLTLNVSDDAIDITGNANTNRQRLAARRIVQSFAGNMRVRERISVAGASPVPARTGAVTVPGPALPAGAPGPQTKPLEPYAKTPNPDPKKDGDKSENPRL
jgi:hypothetical protein